MRDCMWWFSSWHLIGIDCSSWYASLTSTMRGRGPASEAMMWLPAHGIAVFTSDCVPGHTNCALPPIGRRGLTTIAPPCVYVSFLARTSSTLPSGSICPSRVSVG